MRERPTILGLLGAIAAGLIGFANCSPAESDSDSVSPTGQGGWISRLEGTPCSREIAALLRTWGTRDESLGAPPAPGFVSRYRIPTTVLGEWVLVDVPERGAPTLSRLRPAGVVSVSFDGECRDTRNRVADEPRAAGRVAEAAFGEFTDDDLRSLVSSSTSAIVFYVWSPHMPLSLDGYREIAAACDALDLQLVPLLFGGGDLLFAERAASSAGIPRHGLREIASIELILRDAQVHAPTVILFEGRRVSPALPGYRNWEGYRSFIEAFLQPDSDS